MDDDVIVRMAADARAAMLSRLGDFVCGEGPCAPATPQELETPLVSDADAQTAVARGLLSGFAVACGLDWSGQNFRPMMASFRAAGRTQRQMAVIGGIHGYGQGTAQRLSDRNGCSEELRQTVATQLPFR